MRKNRFQEKVYFNKQKKKKVKKKNWTIYYKIII